MHYITPKMQLFAVSPFVDERLGGEYAERLMLMHSDATWDRALEGAPWDRHWFINAGCKFLKVRS